MKRLTSAFTLIELLVVVAIIALLSALAFPAMQGARRQLNQAQCVSNIRQLALVVLQKAQDADGVMPYATPGAPEGWLDDYAWTLAYGTSGKTNLASVKFLVCPVQRPRMAKTELRTYAMNFTICGPTSPRLYAYPHPAKTMFLTEGPVIGGTYGFGASLNWNTCPDGPHQGKASLAFLDGHVELRATNSIPFGLPAWNSLPGSDTYYFWRGL